METTIPIVADVNMEAQKLSEHTVEYRVSACTEGVELLSWMHSYWVHGLRMKHSLFILKIYFIVRTFITNCNE